MLTPLVNAILSNHNVDKQMTDSRGEVGTYRLEAECMADVLKVAYLMADISDVNVAVIRDLYQRLESLSCRRLPLPLSLSNFTQLTISSSNHDAGIVLNLKSTLALDFSPSQRSFNHPSSVIGTRPHN